MTVSTNDGDVSGRHPSGGLPVPEPRPRRPWLRRTLLALAISAPVAVLGLWIAVNRVEWLGPWVANGLRAVVGADAVTALEDFAYGLQDRFNRAWRSGEKPKAYWKVPETRKTPPKTPAAAAPRAAALPPFRLADVGPALASWSAPGDGMWVPMADPERPSAGPYMMKTLLHPDKSRSWAEVFVVALDLRRVRIHLVPGRKEPVATEEKALNVARPGVIPPHHRTGAIAAFNGGFMAEHGQYGLKVDGLVFLKPRKAVCAIAAYKDDTIRVATWDRIEATEGEMVWWRQTPNCMVEDGTMHERLRSESLAKKWGATLDGETVIRRSAVGISKDGQVLFVSITNNTTAPVIAEGMRHAGAVTIAQMDVNFSYPKFVTFEKKKKLEQGEEPKRIAVALAEGFEFSEDEYIRKTALRDFFYVLPKDPSEPPRPIASGSPSPAPSH